MGGGKNQFFGGSTEREEGYIHRPNRNNRTRRITNNTRSEKGREIGVWEEEGGGVGIEPE